MKYEQKFNVGDVVRYDNGPTALMMITTVSNPHGPDVRYYGQTFYGSPLGAYQFDCKPATKSDVSAWNKRFKP